MGKNQETKVYFKEKLNKECHYTQLFWLLNITFVVNNCASLFSKQAFLKAESTTIIWRICNKQQKSRKLFAVFSASQLLPILSAQLSLQCTSQSTLGKCGSQHPDWLTHGPVVKVSTARCTYSPCQPVLWPSSKIILITFLFFLFSFLLFSLPFIFSLLSFCFHFLRF